MMSSIIPMEEDSKPGDSSEDDDVEAFFTRNGYDPQSRAQCDKFARSRLPNSRFTRPTRPQGYCSYTLTLPDGNLVQFRPDAFKLDLEICTQAKAIYGRFAPATRYLGTVPVEGLSPQATPALHAYHLEKIPGIPFSEFRNGPDFADNAADFRERLVEDLAWIFALSFHRRRYPSGETPITRGRIGSSLRQRLTLLESLPSPSTRRHVSEVSQRLEAIEQSPWCLTHGDLVPGNIIVDPVTGHLAGLIDWAEAEWLPFGTALYGLEEVLGESGSSKQQGDVGSGFEYCSGHEDLRRHFWRRLLALSRCGDLGIRPWLREVGAARRLGVLLWFGIAFDDGKIDRVIEDGRDGDGEGWARLEPFLEAGGPMEDEGEEEERRSWVKRMARRIGPVFGRLCG